MTAKEQKVINAEVALLELAKQLGNVSQACNLLSGAANGAALTVTELTGGTSGSFKATIVGASSRAVGALYGENRRLAARPGLRMDSALGRVRAAAKAAALQVPMRDMQITLTFTWG